ncbi:Ca2+ regulator and membrane fusion protein Fig1-domain-containing protein [Lasiosphaeria hispida]|uniref:Ca2+ regulator and membrane fusion protein Fig1-domain-containing protein n=1 Tax=Lasiosphaeria hispida TaxID=260671 RepID=A0AAJ0HND1_9PEZI|nr:Ca2+ regulator and membrane fusion protein Fig1-domain-containing protein [Lasiosphaeria hispida]
MSVVSGLSTLSKFLGGVLNDVGYHHVLMAMTIVPTILVSILLAGCSSPHSMSSIYVLSLSYQKTSRTVLHGSLAADISNSISTALENSTGIEVRAGCFNLCVRRGQEEWECSRDAQALQTRFLDSDPLSLVSLASAVRDDIMIIFPGFLVTQIVLHSIACIALAAFPRWYYDEAGKRDLFSRRSFARVAQFASGAAALFGLASALWQHTAAVAVRSIMSTASYGHVISRDGTAAVTLTWVSYALLMLVFIVILRLRSYVQSFEDPDEPEEVDASSAK